MIYVHNKWAMSEPVCMFAIHDVFVCVCVRACVRACGCSRADDEFTGAANGY